MSQEKTFTFDYTMKVKKVVDGKEVEEKVKKEGEAKAVQFDSIADAVAYFEAQEAGKGEALAVAELNASLKNTAIANMRASLTRIPTIPKSIAAKANEKLDDSEKATFNAIMAKLGLSGLPSTK